MFGAQPRPQGPLSRAPGDKKERNLETRLGQGGLHRLHRRGSSQRELHQQCEGHLGYDEGSCLI